MNAKPITTFNMEHISDETKGMTFVTANPIMAAIMTIIISKSALKFNAFKRALSSASDVDLKP